MASDQVVQVQEKDVQLAILTDRPADIFAFLHEALVKGHHCALVTLVEIIDGASRSLGTHMAVCDDGRYCGFVSGGCVEAAVAREALHAIFEGTDRLCRFGKSSPYFDIALPCGGGICLAIHVIRNVDIVVYVLDALARRRAVGLTYDSERQQLSAHDGASPAGWHGGSFVTGYRPDPRILLSGQGIENRTFASIASSSGIEIIHADAALVSSVVDEETAIVLLHHDVYRELPVLRLALHTDAFYIGCLGSRRTHVHRRDLLQREGYAPEQLDRIHAPIGLFGPAREARSVAVSVLAEILSYVESRRL